jgi:hypothetical protein
VITVAPAILVAREITTRIARVSFGQGLGEVLAAAPGAFQPALMSFINVRVALDEAALHAGHDIGGFFSGVGATAVPALMLAVLILLTTAAGSIIYAIAINRTRE